MNLANSPEFESLGNPLCSLMDFKSAKFILLSNQWIYTSLTYHLTAISRISYIRDFKMTPKVCPNTSRGRNYTMADVFGYRLKKHNNSNMFKQLECISCYEIHVHWSKSLNQWTSSYWTNINTRTLHKNFQCSVVSWRWNLHFFVKVWRLISSINLEFAWKGSRYN